MNQQLVKKINKAMKRNWRQYLKEVRALPFAARWRIAWWIVFSDKKKV